MLTRYRWYRIRLPSNTSNLMELALTHPFDSSASNGFAFLGDGLGGSQLRFLWRTSIVVTRLNADGNPSHEAVESVGFTDFAVVVVGGQIFLRIINPGRNIRDLLNALESLVGLGFTAEAVVFEKSKPTTIFEYVQVTKLVGLKIVGASVEEDLVARMEFASKRGMIVENMTLLDGLNYKVDVAIFELLYEGVRGQVAFSSGGIVKVSGQLASKVIHLIEKDLHKLN